MKSKYKRTHATPHQTSASALEAAQLLKAESIRYHLLELAKSHNEDRTVSKNPKLINLNNQKDESIVDKLYANSQLQIEGRPHCWHKVLFKIVEERVQQRVEAFQIEDRKLNKNWVTRNLEICRLYIVEDLYAAKHFLRIFPKEHQLYNNFVITEIARGELNKRELVQLLSWIRLYP
ncbi:unnamed protein product [Gongylonema pulchrum]|uniref:Uncharacterized protein n=1 Tax=Gongylonema pulchrum TaxID=637853 RepID=A0A183ERX8_9BILA|nr:unnamed protein product [Gongylonema pulchrum]